MGTPYYYARQITSIIVRKKKKNNFVEFGFQIKLIQIGLLNYRLSQKFKPLGNFEFNHLTIILTLPLTCGRKFFLNKCGPNK